MIAKEQYLISSMGFRPGVSVFFSKKNKNDFLRAAYIYIADYFNESLKKLEKEIPRIETAFRPVDESHFMASVYRNGIAVSSCKIRFGGCNGLTGRIAYLTDYPFPEDCQSDILTVGEENGRLFLRSLPDIEKENRLTIKLSAEYLWKKFTVTLKNNLN